jgi:hypothetical protein
MAKSRTAAKSTEKVTPKKNVKGNLIAKEKGKPKLKYTDKSAGQPEMVVVFEAIKKIMKPYQGKGALKLHGGTGGQLNLISDKTVVIDGRKRDEMWFVSALIQKGYVGFYYMPIYMHDEMKKLFSPMFIKCLKGKACFHIKNTDPVIMEDIKKAMEAGYDAYVKKGWI